MLALLVILVVGLIKPQLVLFWSKKPTRLKVIGWWLLTAFVFVMISGALLQTIESRKTPEEIISSSKKDIDDGNYNTAVERLKRITPEDSLYTYAQELIGRADSLSKKDELKSEEKIKISPNSRKLKVMDKTLTFRIGGVSRDSVNNIIISLIADASIPLDNLNIPVQMQISTENQIINCSNAEIIGIVGRMALEEKFPVSYLNGVRDLLGNEASLVGTIYFTFPTTKIPNEIIINNNDNENVKFEIKSKKE